MRGDGAGSEWRLDDESSRYNVLSGAGVTYVTQDNDGSGRINLQIIISSEPLISEFERQRRAEGRIWAEGYSQSELDAAQDRYEIVFPPDLVALFLDRRPVLGYDWRADDPEIRKMLTWPLEGLLFDVENAELWEPEWGERPGTAKARAEVLAKIVGSAPKLIPLVSHRYLPAEPHEAGNPVFSVYQSDIIHYGADLADYFEREFVDPSRPLPDQIKHIRFWPDFVR